MATSISNWRTSRVKRALNEVAFFLPLKVWCDPDFLRMKLGISTVARDELQQRRENIWLSSYKVFQESRLLLLSPLAPQPQKEAALSQITTAINKILMGEGLEWRNSPADGFTGESMRTALATLSSAVAAQSLDAVTAALADLSTQLHSDIMDQELAKAEASGRDYWSF